MADNSGTATFVLYRYVPSLAAAVIFAALFAVLTAWHMWQLFRTRSWYFTPLVIGGLFEMIGYIGRILAHSNTKSIPLYSMQTLLILLAPALFAASIYMVLGRVIIFVQAEHLSVIRLKWMTKIFVSADVLSFCLQGAGGGIMASGTLSAMKTGEHIIIIGLLVQLLCFGFFVVTAGVIHRRIIKFPTPKSSSVLLGDSPLTNRGWETVFWGLYAASFLILIRSVFRVVEYSLGNDGYLISHEIFSYVFDATLMLLTMFVLIVFHPSRVIKGKGRYSEGSEAEMVLSYQQP